MTNPNSLSRGQLARETGINSETILYYEKSGILPAPPRSAGGHRVYNDTHVQTLGFIKRARGLGFAPKEVRAILGLHDEGDQPCEKVKQIAAQHLEQVRSKIADLRQIEGLLSKTVDQCAVETDDQCAVLELLEGKDISR
ncbi:MAG: helix-turn-helix domain-containing protein [Pseudomonadota bacterium]